jgi:hypothetical protein
MMLVDEDSIAHDILLTRISNLTKHTQFKTLLVIFVCVRLIN